MTNFQRYSMSVAWQDTTRKKIMRNLELTQLGHCSTHIVTAVLSASVYEIQTLHCHSWRAWIVHATVPACYSTPAVQ